MSVIAFTKDEKALLVQKLKDYFEQSLDQEIRQFDAEFLLDFIGDEVGVYFYNRGLYDAQALLEQKIETITDGFTELEKPFADGNRRLTFAGQRFEPDCSIESTRVSIVLMARCFHADISASNETA